MKKLICILASAALLGACEQKTDVTVPASDKKAPDNAATGQKPRKPADATTNTLSSAAVAPATSTETKADAVAAEKKADAVAAETKADAIAAEAKSEPAATPNQ